MIFTFTDVSDYDMKKTLLIFRFLIQNIIYLFNNSFVSSPLSIFESRLTSFSSRVIACPKIIIAAKPLIHVAIEYNINNSTINTTITTVHLTDRYDK